MKLAVFFGGKSAEHDISIVTGLQLIENTDKNVHEIIPVYIDTNGIWFSGNKLANIEFVKEFKKNKSVSKEVSKVYLSPVPGINALLGENMQGGLFGKKTQEKINFDVAVVCMHGCNGEDGTLQGLFELANVPFTSTGILGSSAGMDKVLMKACFKGADIPAVPGICVLREDFLNDSNGIISMLRSNFDFPIIVKPANLGSSIGITIAKNDIDLETALQVACQYDRRILVEKAVENMIELNCAVMGFSNNVTASVCEQPTSWQEFLTFEDKYLRNSKNSKSSGMESLSRKIPADISQELTQEIQRLSIKIFKLFDCKGVIRIDYIYDTKNQQLYANEINTLPGSMAFYLWEHSSISFSTLVNKLVDLAIEAHNQKQKANYSYDSCVLEKVGFGSKGTKQ